MKLLILGAITAMSSISFASADMSTVQMRAGAHTCAEYESAIRQYGKIIVKYTFAARAFHAQTSGCRSNEYPLALHVSAKDGSCKLRWACEYDRSNDK